MKLKRIDPFYNTRMPQLQQGGGSEIFGNSYLKNVSTFSAGQGNQSMSVDKQGMWLGAKRFTDAPFKVNMAGEITMTGTASRLVWNDANGVPSIVIGNIE